MPTLIIAKQDSGKFTCIEGLHQLTRVALPRVRATGCCIPVALRNPAERGLLWWTPLSRHQFDPFSVRVPPVTRRNA